MVLTFKSQLGAGISNLKGLEEVFNSLKARVKIQNLQHYDVSKEDGEKSDSPEPANKRGG